VLGVIGALLLVKFIAAQSVGRAFSYSSTARMTMWSLTLPQVAATLAGTLVAFDTLNPAGQHLIDSKLLNVVLVMVVTTSILGPVLTQYFAPRLVKEGRPADGTAVPASLISYFCILQLSAAAVFRRQLGSSPSTRADGHFTVAVVLGLLEAQCYRGAADVTLYRSCHR
jgi:hypothetical protein